MHKFDLRNSSLGSIQVTIQALAIILTKALFFYHPTIPTIEVKNYQKILRLNVLISRVTMIYLLLCGLIIMLSTHSTT